jgi:predicted chitinase
VLSSRLQSQSEDIIMNLNLGDTRLLIEAGRERGLLRNQLAYVLATAYHETAHTMKPIMERGGEKYLRSKKYWPHVGRGYVQITWLTNYKRASTALGVDFVAKPALLMEARYAVPIIIIGLVEGWFTGKRLDHYITLKKSDFVGARRIVNGTDKADLIARYAKQYDAKLKAEGYGSTDVIRISPSEVLPDPVEDKAIGKSSRFWTWVSSGGGTAVMPFVDWRVQLVIVAAIIMISGYAIFTMPQAKAKIQQLLDSL